MKNPLFILLLLFSLSYLGCDTELPDTDITPPEFMFVIKGDGLNRSFTQRDNFDRFQVNLKAGQTYEFTLICSDAGGLAKMAWGFVPDYYVFEAPLESPWTLFDITPLNRQFLWLGNINNPLTGTSMQGTFTVSGQNIANTLYFEGKDFGGKTRSANTFFIELQVYIGDHPTEVIYH